MNSGKRLKILESVEKEIKKTKFDFHKTKLGIIQLVRTQNFPKKKLYFLPSDTHTYVHESGGKKCLFFVKFCVHTK